jgi:prepilin-type processing-associated H-X9-DG protein
VRPEPKAAPQCLAGQECCDAWHAQTPHATMNIALADGSVRSVGRGISPATWANVLQPRDGNTVDADW